MKKAPTALLLLAMGALNLVSEAPAADAVGTLTLPFQQSNIAVNSWFDHNSPGGSNNSNMIRYDGATWTDGSASIANCTLTVNCYDGHAGIDFALGSNSNVVAAASGVVQFVGWQNPNDHNVGFGFYVRVWHSASNYSTLYAHLWENYVVSVGQSIARAAAVGYSGSTGQSDGPHLHFGVYNSQSGWTPMDPDGWSGMSNDPHTPGQTYGDLSAVRISILHGGQQDIKEGTLNEVWLPEYSGVSSIAVAGHRIGRISSGVPYVKDGPWNALWTQEYASASALVLSGRRIGILSGGQARFKEGDLNQAWSLEGSGIQEIAVTHNELGVTNPSRVGMRAGSYFFVKQGPLGGAPTTVATNAKSIALGAGWIGHIDTNNTAWAKEGINDSWVWMQDNVSSLVLGGAGANRRIGIIQNGVGRVKEGSLYNTWVDEWTGVSKLTLNSGRIGVVTTSGLAKVKERGLSDLWVDVYPSVSDLKLN